TSRSLLTHACLDLPSAKTAKLGKTQSVFLTEQSNICPLAALKNLFNTVPARASDPLFNWMDDKGNVHPMVKQTAIKFINNILMGWGWGTSFRHSFRIEGTSYFLVQKVNPEIIRIAGRWKSLTYETYIRAFEQIASRHTSNLTERASLVGRALIDRRSSALMCERCVHLRTTLS
ncbi:hypothetical protein M422DRAFT_161629, partial [Sphaerobolus stellatus SS14]